MRPALLRPTPLGSVVTSGQYGSPLCSPGVTTLTRLLRPGEVGLTFTSGIAYSVAAKLISCPAARRTYAFFQLRRRPMKRPKRFSLPLTFVIVTDSTLVLNISSTAALTMGLVAASATRNTYWRCLSATRVLFSDTTGAITTFISRSAGYFFAAVMRASPRAWPSPCASARPLGTSPETPGWCYARQESPCSRDYATKAQDCGRFRP